MLMYDSNITTTIFNEVIYHVTDIANCKLAWWFEILWPQ